MTDFPSALTNAVDGVTDIVAKHVNNLEAKVGADGSAVATSLDYLLKNSLSINPGHKHSKLWASDGSPESVSVDASGNVAMTRGMDVASEANISALNISAVATGINATQWNDFTGIYVDISNQSVYSNPPLSSGNLGLWGFYIAVNNYAQLMYMYGFLSYVQHQVANTVDYAWGFCTGVYAENAGIITTSWAAQIYAEAVGSGSALTTLYLCHVTSSARNGGSIGTVYGYYVGSLAGATKWGVYVSDAAPNFFAGTVGISTTEQAAKLTIGGSASGSADLVLGSYLSGYTSLVCTRSADTGGYCSLQAISAYGSAYGNIVLNKDGGNVGIGVSSPLAKLDVSNNGRNHFAFYPDYTIFNIYGQIQSSNESPRIHFSFQGDSDPVIGYLCYDHDNACLAFDAWFAGSWIASDTSAFAVYKFGDKLNLVGKGSLTKSVGFGGFDFVWSMDVSGNVEQSGSLKVGGLMDINSDMLRLRSSKTPSTSGATGDVGDICWDSSYVYVCVATNTWKRSTLNSF